MNPIGFATNDCFCRYLEHTESIESIDSVSDLSSLAVFAIVQSYYMVSVSLALKVCELILKCNIIFNKMRKEKIIKIANVFDICLSPKLEEI